MPRVNRRPELRDEVFPETRGRPLIGKGYKHQRVGKCTFPALGKIVRRVGRDQLAAASLLGAASWSGGRWFGVLLVLVSGFLISVYLGSKRHRERNLFFAIEKNTANSRRNRAISR